MDEEHEELDWGHDDDELAGSNVLEYPRSDAEGVDVEDVVSLGGDDDDIQEYADYSNTPLQQGSGKSAPPSRAYSRSESRGGRRDADREPSIGTRRQSPTPLLSPNHGRSRSQQQLKHALPPKPVVASPAFPIPSTTAASPMSMARREKERREAVADSQPPPPGWEVRQSRRGDVYFYNPETKESQWTRPAAPKPKAVELSPPARGRPIILHERLVNGDSWVAAIDGKDTSPRAAGASHSKLSAENPSSFSYDDRHYRPGDAPHTSHPDLSPRLVSTRNEGALSVHSETDHQHNIASRLGHREHSPSRETNGRGAADDRLRPVDSVYRSRPLDHGSHTTYTASRADSPPPRQSATYDRERHYRSDDDPHHSQGAPVRRRSISPAQNSGRYSAPRPRSKSPRMDTWTPATSSHRPSERDREHEYGARSPPPPTLRQESTRRPASPPPRVRPSPPVRQRDTYIPDDIAVPSRRAREPDMSRYDEENEAKRRRTSGMRSNDSAPARRTVAPEAVIPPSVTRTSMSSSGHGAESYPSPSADQTRSRKRLPLPPQQARFREMSSATPPKRPDQPVPPVPPRSPPANRSYAPLPSEPLASRNAPRAAARDPPPHKPSAAFEDMPKLGLPTPPDSHSRLPPPDSSSGRGLRGDRERDREDERMDVDPSDPYTSKHSPYDEPRARRDGQPASYPPRDDIVSRDPVPRAPRAMGRERERDSGYEGVRRGSGSPTAPAYSRRESTTSVVAEVASSRARDRERERERSPIAPSARYREPPVAPARPPVEPARERESVRTSYDWSSRAEVPATAPSIPREPARAPRRTLDNQVPKLSGTNNVPIGPRKVQAPTIPTSVPAQRPSSPIKRRDSTSGVSRAPDRPGGWDRMGRQPPPHMPVRPAMDEDAPSGKRRPEEMNAVQMSPPRTRADTRLPERASRFGPPPSLATPASSSPPVARDGRPLTPEDEYPPRRRASPLPLRSQAARGVGASTSSLDENFIHQTARLRASDPDVRPPPPTGTLSPPPMRERSPPRRERERSPPSLRERSSPRSERSLPPLRERSLPRRDRSPPPLRQRSPPPYVLPRRGSNIQERGGSSYVPVYDKDTPPRTSPNIRGRDRSLPRDLPPHKLARHDSLASRPPYQADRERERERAPQRALTPPLSNYSGAVEDPSVRGADAPVMSYRSRIDVEDSYKYRGMADADLHNGRALEYPRERLENEKVDGRNGNVALHESESPRDTKPKGLSLLSRLSSDMLPSNSGRDEDVDVGMDEMESRDEKRVNGIRDRGDGPSEVPAFVSGANGGGGAEGRGRGRRRSGKPRRGRR